MFQVWNQEGQGRGRTGGRPKAHSALPLALTCAVGSAALSLRMRKSLSTEGVPPPQPGAYPPYFFLDIVYYTCILVLYSPFFFNLNGTMFSLNNTSLIFFFYIHSFLTAAEQFITWANHCLFSQSPDDGCVDCGQFFILDK